MPTPETTREELSRKVEELQAQLAERDSQLAEAQETLRAIREGEVDALVISTPAGQRVFTLQGEDRVYRAIIEQMQEGAVTLLEDGHVNYSNRRFAEMVKRPLERVIGSHFCDHLIEAQRGSFHQLLDQARDRTARGDLTLQASDGTQVPIHVALGVMALDTVLSIGVVVTDLTERKRAEAVMASEQFVRRLIDSSPIGVAVVGRDLRYWLANPAYQAIPNVPVVGRTIAEVFSPAVAEIVQPFVQQVIDTGQEMECRDCEAPIRGRTWWNVSGIPLRDAAGNAEAVMILTQEVTEQKLAEEALRESEDRFRRLFEDDLTGNFIAAPDGQILLCNPAFVRIFGFASREEAIGSNLASVHFDPAELADFVNFVKVNKVVERCECDLRRRDGTAIHAIKNVVGTFNDQGELLQIKGYVLDDTDRKRAEEELKMAKDAAERSKAAAEHANRTKDHFLAVLSHELRTPLTPVVMGVSMLRDRPDLDPGTREMLETVRRNIELEVHLIDDLLDVTRIARGKIELNRSPVELCTVIERAVEVCKPDIEARRLEFGVDIGPSAPYWVEADVPRLQQVFWNLLRNAIKFTPYGGCVGIRCRPNEEHVVVEVNDSGMGIEPEALPRVFNAFEQVERSITQQFGGLGLGLAISKALVEMHGGQIEAHSEGRGKGATFRIRLPLTAPAGQPEMPASAAPPKRAVRPLHILLVEDHGVTAKMMRMVLNAAGHTVEWAGDVATALEMASQQAFDLLVSDLGLPDGSGHDLMRGLRERGYKFPGIALSGYGQEEDTRRSREAGFAAHLTKPASREALLEAVTAATMTTTAEPTAKPRAQSDAEDRSR